MYWPPPGIKRHPERRWNRPDQIFFGHGACHILAGAYLRLFPQTNLQAERIIPAEGFAGAHIFLTDGMLAFDFHGYSRRDRLLAHHAKGWAQRYPGWSAALEAVEFDLLNTRELNAHKMLGPDQYFGDALARADAFLEKLDHRCGMRRAAESAPSPGDAAVLETCFTLTARAKSGIGT